MRMSTGSELLHTMIGKPAGSAVRIEAITFYNYQELKGEIGSAWCYLVLTESGEMYRAFADRRYLYGFVHEALFDDKGRIIGGRSLPDEPAFFAILTNKAESIRTDDDDDGGE